ncbi:hypothetical protein B0T24DRAFT_684633 [Lasiosphaeria ovina]|uniref:Uncharacterized protein n=1 Tax=Lasiosphaeria ovina TaxID=92902 RepID=A0AAE0JUW4_9PEZI|nr:hypothetical protein B0T24DRAFT_684633 [Lasiosphaeria ovina]
MPLALIPIAYLWSALFTARATYMAFVQSMAVILENTAVTFYWLSLLVPVFAFVVSSSMVRDGWELLVLAALACLWWYIYSNFETRTYTYIYFAVTVVFPDGAVDRIVANAIGTYDWVFFVAGALLG